jgi:hypothetical protein
VTSDDVPFGGTPSIGGVPDDDRTTEDLLAGRRRAGTEDEMTLDRLLDALRAPGTVDELAGLEATSAAFRRARAEASAAPALVAVGGRARRSVTAGVAVAAVLATVSMGAAAAAAFTGSLPRPLQHVAHQVIGAPDAENAETHDAAPADRTSASGPSGSADGSGPAVTPGAPALFGLCTAFRDRGPSAVPTGSVAYQDLLAAATAAGKDIASYCADALPAGSRGPSVTPSGRPSVRPTPSTKPTERPSPSRKPSDVPRSDAASTRASAAGDNAAGR